MTTFSPEAYDSINPDQERKQHAMLSPTPRVACTGCGYMTRMVDTQRCVDCADRDERELRALDDQAKSSLPTAVRLPMPMSSEQVANLVFDCWDSFVEQHPAVETANTMTTHTGELLGMPWLGYPWHERQVCVDGRYHIIAVREC